ncbi:hypothetical protein V6Z11_D02G228500 [Gossypium hirsutum]
MALVTFKVTPREALLLKASHKHCGPAFNTVFKPEQQVPSGFDVLLPLDTKDKQSAMLRIREEQSTGEEGEGARAWCWAASTAQIERIARDKAKQNFEATIVRWVMGRSVLGRRRKMGDLWKK